MVASDGLVDRRVLANLRCVEGAKDSDAVLHETSHGHVVAVQDVLHLLLLSLAHVGRLRRTGAFELFGVLLLEALEHFLVGLDESLEDPLLLFAHVEKWC